MRPIVTVIAQLAMILAAAQTQAAPESPAPIHTSKTQFRIPYRYDAEEMRRLDAQEIRLFVSMDGGINWQHVQTVAPATGRFDFVAKGDGEYWFSVRTVDGGGRLFPRGELNRAGLKVIVDATPPRFEVTVRQQKPGRVQLSWRSDDENIDICVIDANAAEDRASVKDCTDKHDEYVDCLLENASCDNDHYGTSDCSEKGESYAKCMD